MTNGSTSLDKYHCNEKASLIGLRNLGANLDAFQFIRVSIHLSSECFLAGSCRLPARPEVSIYLGYWPVITRFL